MTLKNKYQKIMEKIEVSKEMHDRIMKKISETDFDDPSKKSRSKMNYKNYISIAACIALLVVGGLALPEFLHKAPNPNVQIENNMIECNSLDELSKYVGFKVLDIGELPFTENEVTYISYWQELAEIVYVGSDDVISFRMSIGGEDNSGDYSEYEEVKSLQLEDYTVTIKGQDEKFNLAIWKHNGFSYSIKTHAGLSEMDLVEMIQSVQ